MTDIGPGFAAVKGTTSSAVLPHFDALLATFVAEFQTAGDYRLDLAFFNTLGVTEEIFVGGDGTNLDPDLRFGSAIVHVTDPGGMAVPEPADAVLLCVGIAVLAAARQVRFRRISLSMGVQ